MHLAGETYKKVCEPKRRFCRFVKCGRQRQHSSGTQCQCAFQANRTAQVAETARQALETRLSTENKVRLRKQRRRDAMERTATLHFFCGKAGAGKTTVAAGLAQDRSLILLSEDVWLLELYGDEMKTFDDYIRVSKKLKAVVGPLVVDLLRSGQSVVLDFQANTKAGRRWFRSLFEQASVDHVLHFVNTPDVVCLERIARRNVERPPGSHHLTEEDFMHISSFFQPPEETEGFNVKQYTA